MDAPFLELRTPENKDITPRGGMIPFFTGIGIGIGITTKGFGIGIACTACGHRMAHRKWKESKQQPSMLPSPAVPGCSLVSFHFLWAILCPQVVIDFLLESVPNWNQLNSKKCPKSDSTSGIITPLLQT